MNCVTTTTGTRAIRPGDSGRSEKVRALQQSGHALGLLAAGELANGKSRQSRTRKKPATLPPRQGPEQSQFWRQDIDSLAAAYAEAGDFKQAVRASATVNPSGGYQPIVPLQRAVALASVPKRKVTAPGI